MRLTGSDWSEPALHALGAGLVAELRDDAGDLVGFDVEPDLPLDGKGVPKGYAEAVTAGMAKHRQAAFEAAMAFGNDITARVTGAYSDVEARTWPLQRTQADTVLAGGDLPPDALLRKLAARRGMDLEPFATVVQHKAQAFETIADVGQGLRYGAEGLLSPDLDTPAKLTKAVEALRAQALAAAAKLGLTV